MKKILTVLLVAVLAIGVLAFTACGDKGIEGTYKFVSSKRTQGGQTMEQKVGDDIGGGLILTEDSMVLVVKEDKTFTMTTNYDGQNPDTTEGTWEEKDGGYAFTVEGEAINAKLDGNKLTLSIEEDSMSMEYVLAK